jgi:hypothetical protein
MIYASPESMALCIRSLDFFVSGGFFVLLLLMMMMMTRVCVEFSPLAFVRYLFAASINQSPPSVHCWSDFLGYQQ